MRDIGPLIRLQIQRSPLKTGHKPDRTYSPAPILSVERLWIAPEGVLGLAPDGAWLVDAHHAAHPATRNREDGNGVSLGFTGHYRRMRDRFGDRIAPGCAGENLIAEIAERVTLDELEGGVAVVGPDGRERLRLAVLDVARPCRPFTGWALGTRIDSEVLREHLQFLDGGMRGFYCRAVGAGEVRIGDRVMALA